MHAIPILIDTLDGDVMCVPFYLFCFQSTFVCFYDDGDADYDDDLTEPGSFLRLSAAAGGAPLSGPRAPGVLHERGRHHGLMAHGGECLTVSECIYIYSYIYFHT